MTALSSPPLLMRCKAFIVLPWISGMSMDFQENIFPGLSSNIVSCRRSIVQDYLKEGK
jgi:hypothetical protein